jgi:hypothetical protein
MDARNLVLKTMLAPIILVSSSAAAAAATAAAVSTGERVFLSVH